MNVFRLPRPPLPGTPLRLIAKRELEDIEAKSSLDVWTKGFSREAAENHYYEIGAVPIIKPSFAPVMPEDVTRLTSNELGTLAAQFVMYTAWLETELALIEVDSDESSAYLEHIDADIRLRKAGTVSDKNAKTVNDSRFIENEQLALIAKAKAKLLRSRVKGYERLSNALSRELTRRQIDAEKPI